MEQPPVLYARAPDGVNLAYHAFGEGPALVFVSACPFSNIARELEIPAVAAWWQRVAETARVVRYDSRGNGLSDRHAADFSIEAQVRDLAAVIDHLGYGRVALFAGFMATPAAMVFAARYEARVSHLILWDPYTRLRDLYSGDVASLESLVQTNWPLYAETVAHATIGWAHGDLAHEYAAVIRESVEPSALAANVEALLGLDVSDHLPRITVPTLVMTNITTPGAGISAVRRVAALIRGARLLKLEGTEAPVPFVGNPEPTLRAIGEFLAQESPVATAAAALPSAALTAREVEVLSLLAGGRTGKEIASSLKISLSTVQRHIANIYAKIGARGRVDAAAYALSRGLVHPRDG